MILYMNQTMKKQFIIYFLLLLPVIFALGHGGKKHGKDSTKAPMDSTMNMGEDKEHIAGDTTHHHDEGMTPDESKVTADLDDFPTLHPLIVHFAIVLIIVAAALQLLNLILIKNISTLACRIAASIVARCALFDERNSRHVSKKPRVSLEDFFIMLPYFWKENFDLLTNPFVNSVHG